MHKLPLMTGRSPAPTAGQCENSASSPFPRQGATARSRDKHYGSFICRRTAASSWSLSAQTQRLVAASRLSWNPPQPPTHTHTHLVTSSRDVYLPPSWEYLCVVCTCVCVCVLATRGKKDRSKVTLIIPFPSSFNSPRGEARRRKGSGRRISFDISLLALGIRPPPSLHRSGYLFVSAAGSWNKSRPWN